MVYDPPTVPDGVFPVALAGARVQLRELEPSDAGPLADVFGDPDVLRFLATPPQTLEMAQQWISRITQAARAAVRDQYHLCVVQGEDVIGTARIGVNHRDFRRGDVGYAYRRDVWGKGLGTEALMRLLRFGFEELNLHRIEAIHHPDNRRVGAPDGEGGDGARRLFPSPPLC
jgi:RimJ/RimL family protein N-acetyltransferase